MALFNVSRFVQQFALVLIRRDLEPMFSCMRFRPFTRRSLTIVLALGVLLSGAAPSWALSLLPAPADLSTVVSGMAMQGDCMAMMHKSVPKKNAPCQNPDSGCLICTSCAVPMVLADEPSQLLVPRRGEKVVFVYDVSRGGINILPALPPPILSA